MKVVPIALDLAEMFGTSTLPRTPGLHMSEIYGDLYKELEPKRYGRGGAPNPLVLGAGLALETAFEKAIQERLSNDGRPGEFTHQEKGIAEPIIFSPDLLLFNHCTRIGEIKLTWMSSSDVPLVPSNAFPQKFDKYVTQMANYCYMLETPYARLIAFFVNGSYEFLKKKKGRASSGPSPHLLAWDIEFSARELKEEWAMCMNHLKGMKR